MTISFSKTQLAQNTPFDNDTNGFVSDDVQAAIEEVGTFAFVARYTINLLHKGTVSGGTFLGYSEVIPGNSTPVLIPVDSIMKAFSFSNNSALADYTLYFRKNSTIATPFYTISKVNTQFFSQSIPDESFNAGDAIYVSYQDDGQNAADVGLMLVFQAVT
jgi:hypothetical protein